MRFAKATVAAVVLACSFASFDRAQAADCNGTGYRSTFGVNGATYFKVQSGTPCQFAFNMGGVVRSSKIAVAPKNGTVRMLNLSSFEYRAKAGYKGPDTFAIEATGTSQSGSGTSVLTMNVTVQ